MIGSKNFMLDMKNQAVHRIMERLDTAILQY